MNHLKDLNEKQKEAVETTEGPLLILAGAGAGKTKTITHRIVHLIKKGVDPSAILAITFTNKAAQEMKGRVDQHIEADPDLNRPISDFERPHVSTFHALGVYILRQQSEKIGLNRYFTIFDRADSKSAIKRAMKVVDVDPKQHDPGKILAMISRAKSDMQNVDEYSESYTRNPVRDVAARVWREYNKILKAEQALDFDDLILETAKLLKRDKAVREFYQKKWQYIHVDEYQDTNDVQYQIVKQLVGPYKNICVVGDIDQNIYSWRGATIENILSFEKEYPEAKQIVLEENYRSTDIILEAANQIIEKNVKRKEKKMFTSNKGGEKITVYDAIDGADEATFAAEKISEIMRAGTDPSKIAVLYRANFQSRLFEEIMLTHGIPYQVLGTRFFDRKEVKDVLSYIRAAINPDDLTSVGRIINVPTRGIGKVTYLKVAAGKTSELAPAARKKVDDFYSLLAKIAAKIETEKPSEIIKFVFKVSGLEEMYKADKIEGEERIENIAELTTLASRYNLLLPGEGILKLLEDATLATDQDDLEKDVKGVKLMTVHSSKGLEFDYVFVTGLEEGLFPHEGMGDDHSNKNRDEEEERRLFYVAITRAAKKLFLTHASFRTIFGQQRIAAPSEFLDDINDELTERDGSGYGQGGEVKEYLIDF